ncbi:MAG: alpha/beta hydrolase [Bacteroidota bacterium]
MEPQELRFDYKARYYRLGELNANTRQLWFVVHGYGQLAQFFIQKFKVLEEAGICVVAPEGLSRFYIDGNGGRVGASWMTKENRLMDIENYIEYLNEVYKKETAHVVSLPPVTLLGFSQGTATVSRWLLKGGLKVNRLILWAGLFPPDLDFEKGSEILKDIEVTEVYGKRDPFVSLASLQHLNELNEKLNLQPTIMEFDGKHELNDDILLRFL